MPFDTRRVKDLFSQALDLPYPAGRLEQTMTVSEPADSDRPEVAATPVGTTIAGPVQGPPGDRRGGDG